MIKKTINIPSPAEVFNANLIPLILGNAETLKPLVLLEGGRGSGKSRGAVQRVILNCLEKKLRIALVRKVGDTIRDSIYREVQDVVKMWGLDSEFTFVTAPLEIRVANGSTFICKGLDKVEKTKSMASVDLVVIEEANELTKDDWTTLSLTIRGNTSFKQIYLIFNREEGAWTEAEFFNADGSFKEQEYIYHNHSTFQDNRYLDKAFLDKLELLRLNDFESYQKNALGLPVKQRGIIYDNWDIVNSIPEYAHDKFYGIDFGYTDPAVLLLLHKAENEIWIEEKIYETHLTGNQFIEKTKTHIDKNLSGYADSARPDNIQEIMNAGFYAIKPSVKGKDSITNGIDRVKRYKIHVLNTATNTIREFKNYKRKVDKDGRVLETPIDFDNHAMDAMRYAISAHCDPVQEKLRVLFEV